MADWYGKDSEEPSSDRVNISFPKVYLECIIYEIQKESHQVSYHTRLGNVGQWHGNCFFCGNRVLSQGCPLSA